jgi:hypothetical protein
MHRRGGTVGRGLTLVAEVAWRWGAPKADDSKVVWAELQA